MPHEATLITVFVLSICRAAFGDHPVTTLALDDVHARVVWVQDQGSTNSDTLALGRELKLMGYDNQDGRGERAILDDVQNYCKPLITPDGQRIIFSDRYSKEFFVVDWNGNGKRRLGSGFAVEVWKDPKSDVTWIYRCSQVGKLDSIVFKSLRRTPLDGPTSTEPVWDKSEISPDNFQLSANGTIAAGEFPWPHGGTADLTKKISRKRADGCWASLAPDNSGLCWIFDGPHRNVYLYPRDHQSNWKVSLNTAPDFDKYEVFHPRWSNHVRYLAMTGPYKIKTKVNSIAGGGPAVEVYVGRFSEDFRRVEGWARITNNSHGDFFPDLWIEGGESSSISADLLQSEVMTPPVADRWPGTERGLAFLWDNSSTANVVTSEDGKNSISCRVEARGKAKYNRFHAMDCTEGSFIADPLNTRELLNACRKTNELTIEVAITANRANQSGPARIATFGANSGSANFTLGQESDTLVVELKTRQTGMSTVKLGKILPDQLLHLVLTFSEGQLKYYINGESIDSSTNVSGNFSHWSEQQLIFGADSAGTHHWSGSLEGVAIFNRGLTADEARQHFELFSARLDHRMPLERIHLRATCLEVSHIPDPRSIVPYRRALIINRFRVDKVTRGTTEGREILVAQWGILDKTVQKDAKLRVGQSIDLILEDFAAHPELKSERQIVDVDGLELPWYYAVGK